MMSSGVWRLLIRAETVSKGDYKMQCGQCDGIESFFNEKEAERQLRSYRKIGPPKTTQMLIEALRAQGVEGATLLDIGGGIGVIQHELLRSGLASATDVEASTAYMRAAQSEAERQGHADKVSYHHANFVDMAPRIPPADIVTLDRVICCYHDMPSLVGLSVMKVGRLYALVYPRDTWWVRFAITLGNVYFRIVRNPFRAYVHRAMSVEAIARGSGLQRTYYKTSGPWQVVVFAR